MPTLLLTLALTACSQPADPTPDASAAPALAGGAAESGDTRAAAASGSDEADRTGGAGGSDEVDRGGEADRTGGASGADEADRASGTDEADRGGASGTGEADKTDGDEADGETSGRADALASTDDGAAPAGDTGHPPADGAAPRGDTAAPKSEPPDKSVSEPAADKSTSEPATEPTDKSVSEPATEPPDKSTSEPAADAPPKGPITYTLDPSQGLLWVRVNKDTTTAAAALSHNHVIAAYGWSGTVTWDVDDPGACAVSITVPVSGLDPDHPSLRRSFGLEGELSASQREDVKAHALGKDQLYGDKYKDITFTATQCSGTQGAVTVSGELSIRGVTAPVAASMTVTVGDTFAARGGVDIRATQFGFEPYSAMLGALKNLDAMSIGVEVVGTPQ